jgi:hypothetical protein
MLRDNTNVHLVNELKIDKDCHVHKSWQQDYIELIISQCRKFGVTVLSIKKCNSEKKGVHFYIKIKPHIDSNLANRIQYLLGDDSRRVDFNRARIKSGLNEWSKLFEVPNVKLRTIYSLTKSSFGKK